MPSTSTVKIKLLESLSKTFLAQALRAPADGPKNGGASRLEHSTLATGKNNDVVDVTLPLHWEGPVNGTQRCYLIARSCIR